MRTQKRFTQKIPLIAGIALVIAAPVAAFGLGARPALALGSAGVACLVVLVLSLWNSNVSRQEEIIPEGVGESANALENSGTLVLLQKSEKEFRHAFECAPIGMALVSPLNEFLRVNVAASAIFGRTPEELLDAGLLSLVAPEDVDSLKLNLSNLLDGIVRSFQFDARCYVMRGAIIWVRMSASLIPAQPGDTPHFVVQFEDITKRKGTEDRLLHNALYDVLTDLPNRVLFLDRLQVAVNRIRRDPNLRLTALQVDFDRFKLINDRFGQQLADGMLVTAAQRLRKILRATNTVARLGADEFGIFIEDGTFEEVLSIVERIRQELSRPFDVEGEIVYSTVSVGIAIGSAAYESAEFLFRDANTALKQAKRSGRDRYEIFVDEMHSKSIDFLQMETDLRHALERGEFRVLYQPIVTLETGIMAGFESLVRWNHPTRGFISPVEFIPIAEETGMIIPIGEWILRESCRQLSMWQMISDRSQELWVSVNVSSKQFVHFDLVSLVAGVLEDTGLEPRCLKLEITESTMVENIEYVASVMEKLKALGVKLSIDDFGTGFSSLSILHRFPLDSLKIDRSFVSQIKDADRPVEIVKTIVNLARSLDLEIIAEGVETIEQLSQLRQLGCQFGQGYCFATPLSAETIEELLGLTPSSSAFYYLLPAETLHPATVL